MEPDASHVRPSACRLETFAHRVMWAVCATCILASSWLGSGCRKASSRHVAVASEWEQGASVTFGHTTIGIGEVSETGADLAVTYSDFESAIGTSLWRVPTGSVIPGYDRFVRLTACDAEQRTVKLVRIQPAKIGCHVLPADTVAVGLVQNCQFGDRFVVVSDIYVSSRGISKARLVMDVGTVTNPSEDFVTVSEGTRFDMGDMRFVVHCIVLPDATRGILGWVELRRLP